MQHSPGPLSVARVRGVHVSLLHRADHRHRNPLRTDRPGVKAGRVRLQCRVAAGNTA